MENQPSLKVAVIGGGAAGFFCAINIAQKAETLGHSLDLTIFESSHQFLKKVRISGGGRCNVTHNLFDVSKFCENYPRGQRELLSPMQRFQAADTLKWFHDQGVKIVAEADGRMFPESNSSSTIISTYLKLAKKFNIKTLDRSSVKEIHKKDETTWEILTKNEEKFLSHKILIATGSSPGGYELAKSLGHRITERAPSLFSFKISDPLLEDLQGLSFKETTLQLEIPGKKTFKQKGPSLITHWGLSGPGILKLSAWAAREMKQCNYQAKLTVNWIAEMEPVLVLKHLQDLKAENPKSQIKTIYPAALAKRFWIQTLNVSKINPEKQWANLSKKELNKIHQTLTASVFKIDGQNRFKDEFVECGGVSLKEIDFRTMESRKAPGIYFAGEILDIDGITGGFNFQNAWTTGWIAAQSIAQSTYDKP